ncbi:hypothetical protein ACQ4M3_18980 [Leptolyngbya sp. AN03gr2]|uniref:hypothetical protein n=1 Tax=Leptolyngbya sp. AN03gr2 TaxID=3423364 RepID=UPI003D310759
MSNSYTLNPTAARERYTQLGLIDPQFASFRLMTESKRAAESSVDFHKTHALDRLVSNQCRILKGSNEKQELQTLRLEIGSLPVRRGLEDYHRHQQKASAHLSEAIASIQDTGTGKDITLASSDVRVASTHYSVQANTSVWEAAFANFSFKQLVMNNAYTHLISDVDQRTVKHAWLRAEKQNTVIAQTSTLYVEQDCENVYGTLRDTTSDRVMLCDHYLVQVGEDFSNKTNLLPKVEPLSALSNLGSLSHIQSFTDAAGGLANLERYVQQVGDIPSFTRLIEETGGLRFLESLSQGSIESITEKIGLLPDRNLGSLQKAVSSFSDPLEAARFLQSDPATLNLFKGLNLTTFDEISRSIAGLDLLHSLNTHTFNQTKSPLTGKYGTYEVRAQTEIIFETPGRFEVRGVSELQLEPIKKLTLKSAQTELMSTGRLEVRSNAETSISSVSTVRIDGSAVFINCLSPRPVKPPVPKPPSKPIKRKPKAELLKPLPRTPLKQTIPAAGVRMGDQKFILPPTGTAGAFSGMAPSEHSAIQSSGATNTSRPPLNPSTRDRGF